MSKNRDRFGLDQERVLAAIRDGATTVTTIEARTGLKSRAGPALHAVLSKAGAALAYQNARTRATKAALVRALVDSAG
jgi:hypothetical protein